MVQSIPGHAPPAPPRTSDREPRTDAERFVRSIKEECLERIVPIGEWHLRRALREFVEHCHTEPNHQGIASH